MLRWCTRGYVSFVIMPTVHYYGKKTNFIGKTLFEILANLRNFGVNRMLIKQEELLRNPNQKCYYIVKKIEPVMDPELKEGAIYAERVFKGAKVPGLVFIDEETWHTDWQLIPKHEEDKYLIPPEALLEHGHPSTVTVLPRWMEAPPLMDVFLRKHFARRAGAPALPGSVDLDTNPLNIKMHYKFEWLNKPHQVHRIAEEGEESPSNFNKPLQALLREQFRPMKETSSGKHDTKT